MNDDGCIQERTKVNKVGMNKRDGDWTCPKCQVNVFAGKDNCFKCQTPHPNGSSEEK